MMTLNPNSPDRLLRAATLFVLAAAAFVLAVFAVPLNAQSKPSAAIYPAPVQAPTIPAAPAPTLTYRIAGTLVNSITGAHLAHATVSILSEASGHALQSVVTNSDGHFAFESLSAGKYPLTASKRGYLTAFYDQHEEFNSAIVTGSNTGSESYVDIEHLNFKLVPEAVLRGFVTADGGDPVDDATVRLFRRTHDHGLGQRIASPDSTTTDDTGAYEFTGLAPGNYLLAVTANPWYALHRNPRNDSFYSNPSSDPSTALDVAYPVTFYDSTSDESTAIPISLTGGGEEDANINLHAVQAINLAVPTPVAEDDQSARHGTPPALHQLIFGIEIAGATKTPSTTTGGVAEFNSIAPGHYELEQGDPTRLVALDATNSQMVDSDSGTPVGSIHGTLHSANGQPYTDALNLALIQVDGSPQHDPIQTVSADGKFKFDSVPPGNWSLWAANGDNGLPIASLASNGFTHPGSDVTVPDHRIELAVTLSENLVRVRGIVRKAGKGFPGAMVVLVPKSSSAFRALVRRDQTDSDGSFLLRDVPAGQYTVVAIEDGWNLDWMRSEVMRRYLVGGLAVKVSADSRTGSYGTNNSSNTQPEMQLPASVQLQNR